jgi:signal transduction histidine kinase
MNPTLDAQVVRRLTRYYILALTAVALLTLAGQAVIQYSLGDVLDDARVINIAGRQRMLSQRLAKRAILLTHPTLYPPGAAGYARDFDAVLALWKGSHDGLRTGRLVQEGRPVAVRRSRATVALFDSLQPPFTAMYAGLAQISRSLGRQPAGATTANDAALRAVLAHEREFLRLMDAIVFQYDRETRQRVDRVRSIELWLAVVTFVVLLLEGLFVFRPVVAHTGGVIQRLMQSETGLQTANEQLRFANQSLRQTQEALLRTAEEKHHLEQTEARTRSVALLEGQEEERRRLARELHDGIGQMLTGLKLHTEQLGSAAFTEKQRRTYDELRRLLHDTMESTRTVAHNLMPSVLSDFGVAAALRLLAEQTAKTAGVRVQFSGPEHLRLPPPVETGLYRLAQEALHNAVKHADATRIRLELSQKNGFVTLLVEDDGRGFDPRKKRGSAPGSGLRNLRTRAELLNGSVKISSEPGKGTRVLAKLPG